MIAAKRKKTNDKISGFFSQNDLKSLQPSKSIISIVVTRMQYKRKQRTGKKLR